MHSHVLLYFPRSAKALFSSEQQNIETATFSNAFHHLFAMCKIFFMIFCSVDRQFLLRNLGTVFFLYDCKRDDEITITMFKSFDSNVGNHSLSPEFLFFARSNCASWRRLIIWRGNHHSWSNKFTTRSPHCAECLAHIENLVFVGQIYSKCRKQF